MLVFDHVCVFYGDTPVLRELSFQICSGEQVGLIGANGSGKTSLLRILSEDLEPAACTVVHYGNGLWMHFITCNTICQWGNIHFRSSAKNGSTGMR